MTDLVWGVALAGVMLVAGCGKQPIEPPQVSTPPTNGSGAMSAGSATNVMSTQTLPPAACEKLRGKWLRPDGGYVLEIEKVEPTGKVTARYLNPRPINISKAEVTMEKSAPRLLLELRDTGYPGCTYTLMYDAQSDQLLGVYHQAAMGQTFDVVFVRTN